MHNMTPLLPGRYYHIYTRGNNREDLFREERNYRYFLELYTKQVHPIVDTYAYCLMRTHFHLLIRVKETSGVSETPEVCVCPNTSRAFGNLFNAYAKAINKVYGRTGRLFEEHFKRIEITSDTYFTNLIFYIHFNPQKHGFVKDFHEWPWSSYAAFMCSKSTQLQRDDVLAWFGGADGLARFHEGAVDERVIESLIEEDFE